MNIYLFDVDGTLTPPRQKMTDEFWSYFEKWLIGKDVYLVSGSDLIKIKQQLPQKCLDSVNGTFTCMGNVFYKNNKKVYENKFEYPRGLKADLNRFLQQSEYKVRCGNHVEERTGMINFSVVGRNADYEQRRKYHRWDIGSEERKKIASFLNEKYDGKIEVSVGGEISMDICNLGKDKSQVFEHLKNNIIKDAESKIIFFGDRAHKGGNDYSLVKLLIQNNNKQFKCRVVTVNSCKDTLWYLQNRT